MGSRREWAGRLAGCAAPVRIELHLELGAVDLQVYAVIVQTRPVVLDLHGESWRGIRRLSPGGDNLENPGRRAVLDQGVGVEAPQRENHHGIFGFSAEKCPRLALGIDAIDSQPLR